MLFLFFFAWLVVAWARPWRDGIHRKTRFSGMLDRSRRRGQASCTHSTTHTAAAAAAAVVAYISKRDPGYMCVCVCDTRLSDGLGGYLTPTPAHTCTTYVLTCCPIDTYKAQPRPDLSLPCPLRSIDCIFQPHKCHHYHHTNYHQHHHYHHRHQHHSVTYCCYHHTYNCYHC